MGNSEWDNYLKELLGEFKSEGETPHWDEFTQRFDKWNSPGEESDPLADENLKEALSTYQPSGEIQGWDRIEASLNAEDNQFDENIRKKINQYQPAYDPHSWSLFLKQLSANKLLRVKLIALKLAESSALILLILTIVNISRQEKLPFTSEPVQEKQPVQISGETTQDRAYNSNNKSGTKELSIKALSPTAETNSQIAHKISANTSAGHSLIVTAYDGAEVDQLPSPAGIDEYNSKPDIDQEDIINTNQIVQPGTDLINSSSPVQAVGIGIPITSTSTEKISIESQAEDLPSLTINEAYITETLSLNPSPVAASTPQKIPVATLAVTNARKYIEFGMMAQVDYNQLKMPEDRLYSFGRTIVFPLQGITSPGYGGGFTLAIGHPRWALETGLVYSAKTFKPGRQLTIGDEFDNGSVEFEAMRLQLVSVPLQFRYRFEPKGRVKAYAMAGFGMHVIVQSDIDIMVKYKFSSLAAGENPNNNLALAQTIRETRRISEDFKDGAPFSTKSFISANLGLGLEYLLRENKTLFLQTAYQYQIPNLRFSNHNGKHVLSLSLQAGVRTPLGS